MFYPYPIDLRKEYITKPNNDHPWPRSCLFVPLTDLVDGFFGDQYRPAVWQHCAPFLNRRIYGDEVCLAEIELDKRHRDYIMNQSLPCPFGMGGDWYVEVRRLMRSWNRESEIQQRWELGCWKHNDVWDALGEWIALTDF
jgi:hypothetical protein